VAINAKTIRISKFNAARLQLNTAIRLWFQDGDPVSVLTLVYASHEILHRLYKNEGYGNLLYDTAHIPTSEREAFVQKLKLVPNFLKHANRDAKEDGAVQFSTGTNIVFLFFSVLAVKGLIGSDAKKLTDEEMAFLAYCLIHEPSWFPEGELKNSASVDLAQLRPIKSAEFLETFIKAMGTHRLRAHGPPTHS